MFSIVLQSMYFLFKKYVYVSENESRIPFLGEKATGAWS